MPSGVTFVLFDGVQTLDLAGPIDAFASANGLDHEQPRYELTVASLDGGSARTAAGLTVAADASLREPAGPIDTLVVPGGRALSRDEPDLELVAVLEQLIPTCRRICAVCTGAFVLAATGVLDGRHATTHWSACAELAERHPAVMVEPDRIFVRDGPVHTSAGVTAGIDLSLALIEEDLGPAAARTVARRLVVFLQRPGGQSQFSEWVDSRPLPAESPLRGLVDAVVAAPADDHSVAELAKRAVVSERHLSRLFAEQLGTTPARFVERVRVEAARTMLEATDVKLAAVAAATGFASPETLRRAFVRALGVSPGAYRERFGR